jgi:hypothetical protein
MELQLAYQQGLDDVRGRTRIELGDELRDKEERQKFEAEMAKGAFVLQGQRASALEQENMLLRRELLALTRENTAMRRHEDDKIGQQGDKIDLRRIHRLTSWGQSGVPVLFRVEWKENADFDIHLFRDGKLVVTSSDAKFAEARNTDGEVYAACKDETGPGTTGKLAVENCHLDPRVAPPGLYQFKVRLHESKEQSAVQWKSVMMWGDRFEEGEGKLSRGGSMTDVVSTVQVEQREKVVATHVEKPLEIVEHFSTAALRSMAKFRRGWSDEEQNAAPAFFRIEWRQNADLDIHLFKDGELVVTSASGGLAEAKTAEGKVYASVEDETGGAHGRLAVENCHLDPRLAPPGLYQWKVNLHESKEHGSAIKFKGIMVWGKNFEEKEMRISKVGTMTGKVTELRVAPQKQSRRLSRQLSRQRSGSGTIPTMLESCPAIVLPQPNWESDVAFSVQWPQNTGADLDIHMFFNGDSLCDHLDPKAYNNKGEVYATVTDADGRGVLGTTEQSTFIPRLAPPGTYTFKINYRQRQRQGSGDIDYEEAPRPVDWHSSFRWGSGSSRDFNHERHGQICSGATVDVLELEVPYEFGRGLLEASVKWHLLEALVKHHTSPLKNVTGPLCLPFLKPKTVQCVNRAAPALDLDQRAVLLKHQLDEAESKGFARCDEAILVCNALEQLESGKKRDKHRNEHQNAFELETAMGQLGS